MDLATVGGLVVCIGLILASILMGGPLGIFVDVPSVMIVIGGTFAVLFIAFPGNVMMASLKAAKAAVFNKDIAVLESVQQLSELSNVARREGLLALESAAQQTEDDFLKRGLLMLVDGHEAAAIEDVLYQEIAKTEERHKVNASVWDAIGAYGPAMGMIGTLIGLVQMLQNLSDPAAIGPAMAVALLTTFYGSLLANIVGVPIANKLQQRSGQEIAAKEVVASGLLSILNGENPRFMVDRLNASLAPSQRFDADAQAA